MSFAPPKQTVSPAARAPADPARDDPISGRLARAATGVSYDASEGVTVSPGGTRRLWLVESARAPRSPGVATVAAVNARFARLRKAPDIVIVRDTDADARADG